MLSRPGRAHERGVAVVRRRADHEAEATLVEQRLEVRGEPLLGLVARWDRRVGLARQRVLDNPVLEARARTPL
jgi:hypothetical protein